MCNKVKFFSFGEKSYFHIFGQSLTENYGSGNNYLMFEYFYLKDIRLDVLTHRLWCPGKPNRLTI